MDPCAAYFFVAAAGIFFLTDSYLWYPDYNLENRQDSAGFTCSLPTVGLNSRLSYLSVEIAR